MSSAFDKLPTLRTYAGAKTFHDTRTPIRGQASQPKPLGARTDWQRFRIRATTNPLHPTTDQGQAPEPSIECVLYKTPVVTYHPDNTVSITTGTDYTPSQSTAKFISEILGHCCYATCQANRIVLVTTNRTDTGDNETHKYAIAAGQTLAFNLPNPADPLRSRGLTPLDPTPQTTIVIDRAAANNVRKRYGDFYRYLKAAIALRTVNTNKDHPGYLTIPIQLSEYKDNLPIKSTSHRNTHVAGYTNDHWLFDLPNTQQMSNKPATNSTSYTDWHTNVSSFLTPLQPTQPAPEDQYVTFYRAFLMLAHWARFEHRQFFRHGEPNITTFVTPDAIRSLFDELLFKFHSNEVFATRPVKTGQAPGTKYLRWVDWTTDKF